MIPTPQALAVMAAVVCPQDDGDPFGWGGVSELTPEGASRGEGSRHSAPGGVRGGIPLPVGSSAPEGPSRASGRIGGAE